MTWQARAACVGDPRMTKPDRDSARAAIAAHCATCPVTVECAMWAEQESRAHRSTHHGFEGVAGGMWWVDGRPRALPRRSTVGAPEEVAAGHAAWVRGERTERTLGLEREYQRLRHLRRKKAATA